MLRDQNKDEEYFNAIIDELLKENNYFKKQVLHCVKWRKNRDGISRMNSVIDSNMQKILICRYSRGDDINQLIEPYKECVNSMVTRWWDDKLEMQWMMAIGIMLNIDQDSFTTLIRLSEHYDLYKDYLIRFFSDYMQKKTFDPNDLSIERAQIRLVKQIIEEKSPKRESMFKNYVEKKWYPSCKQYYWYQNHEISYGALHEYFGYWCFEGGAVAKILGIDDVALQNCKYYPYDLVHFI